MVSKKIRFPGRIEWRNKAGQQHRLDGPAVEERNGTRYWLQNGKLHRLDGPAIEYNDGSRLWFKNGQYHRLDGPAIEYTGGYKNYYINGRKYFPLYVEFEKIIKKIKKDGK